MNEDFCVIFFTKNNYIIMFVVFLVLFLFALVGIKVQRFLVANCCVLLNNYG